MTQPLSLEPHLQAVAACLPLGRQSSSQDFDLSLFANLKQLENASQQQPGLRDVFRKRCFDLCAFELDSSPLLRRIRYKPLGYAGDFEMMDMLYHPTGDNTLWTTFLQRQKVVQAFRQIAAPHLTGSSLLLVRPIYRSLEQLSDYSLHVLEPEPKALNFAKTFLPRAKFYGSLEEAMPQIDFIFVPYALHRLPRGRAEQFLVSLWQNLSPGGTLLLYQLEPCHSLRFFMEWCLDWTLEYHEVTWLQSFLADLGGTVTAEQYDPWWRLEVSKM